MANIQTLLQKIMNAIYGEEVRGSIHDAIEAINDEVEEWTELQDGTVTTAKIADGSITRAKLNADVVDAIYQGAYYVDNMSADDWLQGWWGVSSGGYDSEHTNAICLRNYLYDRTITEISCDGSHKMRLQAWTTSLSYVGFWNGSAFVTVKPNYYQKSFNLKPFYDAYPNYIFKLVMFADDGSSPVTVSDGASVSRYRSVSEELLLTENRTLGVFDYSSGLTWEIGSIYQITGKNYDGVTRGIRTPSHAKIRIVTDCNVLSVNPLIETVYAFKYDLNGTYIERLGTDKSSNIDIEGGYLYRFVFLAKSETVITTDTLSDYSEDGFVYGESLARLYLEEYQKNTDTTGYCIGTDMLKRNIKAERVGTGSLTYGQSFLIYNNKFYSTDGAHIAVQSADFTLEQNVTLSVGHGNAFTLGSNNKGYVSGWNDNKVYIVNLDDLTLEGTIDIPTTGYTTCAVDDENGIAYIFQRETRPNTESKYNVIAYDYINENVLYTNETTKAFGAMQACDYYNDKIIVLNGIGTTELPNGYRVYNTKGEILADYVIPDFATIEPEGVFIDKSTGELYISLVNARVYKISIA